jgi:putative oxidoreductase
MSASGLLLLRLALAVVFVAHGLHKLAGFFAGPGVGAGGLDWTAATYAGMGLEPSLALAVAAALTQLIGGICLAVGVFSRWAAAAILVYVLVGIWVEHWQWGFFLNWVEAPGRGHGLEYSVVLAGALAGVIGAGPGHFSIDGYRAKTAASRAAGRARLLRR